MQSSQRTQVDRTSYWSTSGHRDLQCFCLERAGHTLVSTGKHRRQSFESIWYCGFTQSFGGDQRIWRESLESTCNARDPGLIPGSGRSCGEGNGNRLQYSCLGNPMNRGVYSPQRQKESDTTERLTLYIYFYWIYTAQKV